MNTPKKKFSAGSAIEGWQVKSAKKIPELLIMSYELEHRQTGARLLYLDHHSAEISFSLAFKTVPQDSTGAAHILEHTVLAGSRKYPVRDPFFSMLKRSLSSFMNAFTSEDWTAYPFATPSRRDFDNLLSVYLDAAFFPLLDELSFAQEGWRLEYEKNRARIKGVVYNEMKGAMSSPGRIAVEAAKAGLFPTTPYRYNSGGDPRAIPGLTHKKLKAFHARYYHPSNAWFFLCGSLDLAKTLRRINHLALNSFSRLEPLDISIKEPDWDRPRSASVSYPYSDAKTREHKYQYSLNWRLHRVEDSYQELLAEILEYVLIGTDASPLKAALVKSGLGSDLADNSGLVSEYRQAVFGIGLKDIARTSARRIDTIIRQTLESLSRGGVEDWLVRAAVNHLEIKQRQVTSQPFPYGLKLWLSLIEPWLHGGDPVAALELDKNLRQAKERLKRKNYLGKCIKKIFIDNPNRLSLLLMPDLELARKLEEKESRLTRNKLRNLDAAGKKRIRERAEQLAKMQGQEEDSAVLPMVDPAVLRRRIKQTKGSDIRQGRIRRYPAFTHGLAYLYAVSALPDQERLDQALIPILCQVWPRLGTRKKDQAALSRYLSQYTGGISLIPQAARAARSPGEPLFQLFWEAKAAGQKLNRLYDIFEEIIYEHSLTDQAWLKNYISEMLAAQEASLMESGHIYASLAAGRGLSESLEQREGWQGISALRQTRKMAGGSPADLSDLGRRLTRLAKEIIEYSRIKLAIVGQDRELEQSRVRAGKLASGFRAQEAKNKKGKFQARTIREGWPIDSAVSYAAAAWPCARLEDKDSAALLVAAKLLRSEYLHKEIREKGGAYGGLARYEPGEGVFYALSYRDPRIVRTLDVFGGVGRFLSQGRYSNENIKEAVIQTIAEMDRPMSPAEAARNDFLRRSQGITDDMRQAARDRVLSLGKNDLQKLGEKYFSTPLSETSIAVIAGSGRLKQANRKLKKKLIINSI